MKTNKKNAPSPKTAVPNIALNPQEATARRLKRLLMVWGSLALGLVLIFTIVLYGDRLLPSGKLPWAFGKVLPMREPVLNTTKPPGPAPEGMVWIPGGEFYMGIDDERFMDAAEIHLVYVDGFWMDKYEVTNEEYAKFVAATKYETEAEKKPNPRDFPDVPPDELKPFSIVFKKPGPNDQVNLAMHTGWWDIGYGACWNHPEGPKSTIKGREKHPVVHISYDDAVAYCKWAKKRLPTEAEWEFAARGGLDRKIYAWGDELKPNGKWMTNVWQGNFPYENTNEDGFEGAAPVGSFPPNGYGLFDMAGNAWEWCADWYRPDYYRESPAKNPQGPDTGYDPAESNTPKRVQRGGSFICADNYCVRYVVGARGKGEVTSAAGHVGFRCAK